MLVLRSIYDLFTRVVALKISIVCVIFNTPVWYEPGVDIFGGASTRPPFRREIRTAEGISKNWIIRTIQNVK